MDLAKTLLRITVRAFYGTEHILIVDALSLHGTLTDSDLALVLGMQPKALRRICGKLKEDGLVSVHSRGEKKEGAPPQFNYGGGGPPKERLFYRDWYYLNFHRAIDSLKYKLWKLNRHIESLGAPTTEKKDLICPRCKSTYTELEVMDNIGDEGFLCHRCGHLLDAQEDTDGPSENESMKRMNDQLAKIVGLMRQIDSTNVPENDFDHALSHALPINRTEANPAAKTQPVDDVKPTLASAKGLSLAPEKISVSVSEDGPVVQDTSEARAKREKEAKQNMLPEWISKSTINGEVTAVGAREEAARREREALQGGLLTEEDDGEDKKPKDVVDNAVMDEYWQELKAAQERERQEDASEEEDDDDDFEDVDVGQAPTPAVTSNGAVKPAVGATPSTSGAVSSNATDDEGPDGRQAKRVRLDVPKVKVEQPSEANNDTISAKDAVSDEDDFEFEDV